MRLPREIGFDLGIEHLSTRMSNHVYSESPFSLTRKVIMLVLQTDAAPHCDIAAVAILGMAK